ncbi:MAG TPA: YqaJ viral recombinase family protein [Haloferula sp.]
MEQRSEQWFRARAGRPTASQFSRIITATGKDSEQWPELARDLTVECVKPQASTGFFGSAATEHGEELEPEARLEFERVMEMPVTQVGFVSRTHVRLDGEEVDGIAGCSPDGLIYRGGELVAGLEIKCPKSDFIHGGYLIDEELPAQYRPQVHGSMAVTGLSYWYFMSYCPGLAPFITRVEWDDYTDKVVDALDRFVAYYAERRKQLLPRLLGKEA